jgi:hypothetical protein
VSSLPQRVRWYVPVGNSTRTAVSERLAASMAALSEPAPPSASVVTSSAFGESQLAATSAKQSGAARQLRLTKSLEGRTNPEPRVPTRSGSCQLFVTLHRHGIRARTLVNTQFVVTACYCACTSTAPISQRVPCGRATPRASVASEQAPGGIWSMRTLRWPGSRVGTGPPLSASWPSAKFALS